MANTLEVYLEVLDENREIIEYDSENTKELRFPIKSDYEDLLNRHNIKYNQKAGKLCVEKLNLPFSYFINIDEFKNEVRYKHLKKDCIIHNYDDSYLFFSKHDNKALSNGKEVDVYIFNNTVCYFKSKDFFKSNYTYNDGEFEFTDFYSDTDCVIGFSLPGDKSRLVLKFPKTGIPNLSFIEDYSKNYDEFVTVFNESKHHPIFLKNAMVSNLLQSGKEVYKAFFDKLIKINRDAKLNFNVYLHELSLDKIKAEYKEYKKKYYGNQNEILNKISSQVLALPVSVAGSAFALFKLKDSTFAIILICFALCAFVVYVSYIVAIYWYDIITMNRQMDYDFTLIKEHKFFKDNEGELNHFQEIHEDLKNRVNKLKTSLRLINGLVWVLNLGLIIFGFTILSTYSEIQYLIMILVGLTLYVTMSHFFIFKDQNT
ncbi:hypothetical protein [Algibacter sp. Ld11]|uniref:hypothetical protein n=1 Tax=Algibacter sp. Ld11 TaxID=649150 RepID=UPI003864C4C2